MEDHASRHNAPGAGRFIAVRGRCRDLVFSFCRRLCHLDDTFVGNRDAIHGIARFIRDSKPAVHITLEDTKPDNAGQARRFVEQLTEG